MQSIAAVLQWGRLNDDDLQLILKKTGQKNMQQMTF